jgi:hypothetical protein
MDRKATSAWRTCCRAGSDGLAIPLGSLVIYHPIPSYRRTTGHLF